MDALASHLPLKLLHLRVEHQVDFFMGCDCHIENWWRWVKGVFKIKEPIARSENALQIQIITALITDVMLKVFKKVGSFPGSLYEFVVRCQEMSLVSLPNLADSSLRRTLELIKVDLLTINLLSQPARAA